MAIEFDLEEHYYELDQIMDHVVNYHGVGSSAEFLQKMSLPNVDIDVIKVFMEHLVNETLVDVVPRGDHWDDHHFFSIKRNHRSKPFLEGGGYTDYYKRKMETEKEEIGGARTIHNHGIYNEGNTKGNQSFSSKTNNTFIPTKAETSIIKKLTVGISIGVIVGLILFYIFGIGG